LLNDYNKTDYPVYVEGLAVMLMVTPTLRINSQRLKTDFDDLAKIGATRQGGISRAALSNEDLTARAWFAERIEESELALRDDEVGNLSGVLYSRNVNAKTLLIGSHLDTLHNAGKYDGSVGVLAGLECLRTLREAGVSLPFHVEVINFTDTEGWWQSLFGSMGVAGTLTEHHIKDTRQDNAPFRAALHRAGIVPQDYYKAQREPSSLLGYLELHIEQSDRLEKAGVQIGAVTRIVGRTAYRVTFFGEAVHAATNYHKKRDALQGAACFITDIHSLPQAFEGGTVNCGNLEVSPAGVTIVPSQVDVTLELRHTDAPTLLKMQARMVELAMACAECHHLRLEVEELLHRDVALMAEEMLTVVESVCAAQGLSCMRLESYVGHDAQNFAPLTPSALIFIPCKDGISMNPKEYTDWANVENGANVLLGTILRLAGQ
jgi:hydantoinase/carbamoylase family amidase